MDSHSIGLIRDPGCEGDKGHGCTGMACLDTVINEEVFESEFDSHAIGLICEPCCDGERGYGFSGMPCSDDGRLLGLICEPSCEGDKGSDCWSDTICSANNGEETELGLCKTGDVVRKHTGVTDLLGELDSDSE